MKDTLPDRVRIGAFELDLRAGELRDQQRSVYLQEQPLFILRVLVERAGGIVTRDELKQKMWPNDTVVDFDHGINAAIRRLRLALGDSADQPKYVETVARRGYRLMVPVEPLEAGKNGSSPAAESASSSDPGVATPARVEETKSGDSLIGKKVSHYRVLNVIGAGGMGLVYEAEDLKLSRRVALKFLPEELAEDPTALERFEREAKTASSLNHPNICTIHEVEESEGRSCIVMELLKGQTLRDRLKAESGESPIALEQLLDVGVQVANGLQAAHDQGIIHRDIKPANIFLTTSGQAKILDFGVAKLIEQAETVGERRAAAAASGETTNTFGVHLTGTGLALGTAAYMSPEQVRGEKLDARTDVFSFGLVLYEMATGQRAYAGNAEVDVKDAILNHVPAPVRALNPAVPQGLEKIINTTIEKNREQRYASAAEVAWALEDLREATDRTAAQPKRTRHLAGWLTAAAVLCVAVVAGVLYWRAQKTPKLTHQDTIVIADFDNKTGDAVFDDTLKQALSIQLEQSPFLNVLSSEKTKETLKLMNRQAGERLSQDVAHEVCVRSNSQALLAGSIASIGNQYLIGLRATDCQTGDTLASAEAEADNRNHVLQALSEVANKLREKLGESGASVQKFNQPLEQVTTSSLEALQAYTQGRKLENTTSPDAPLAYFKRAVDLDPKFAIGYIALSNTYALLMDGANQSRYLTKAYELRDRVSLRERYKLEASYYNNQTGEIEKEIITLTEWAQAYPDDQEPHDQLSAIYSALGQYDKSIVESSAAVRLNPNRDSYTGLVRAYVGMNRLPEAKSAFNEAITHNLDGIALRQIRFYVAFIEGDEAGMKEQDAWATANPLAEALQVSMHSSIAARRGQFGKARELMRDAEVRAARAGLGGVVDALKIVHGPAEADAGNTAVALQAIKEVWTQPKNTDYIESTVALTFAFLGRRKEAESLIDKMNRAAPLDTVMQSYTLPTIRAVVELKSNNARKAIELLRVTEPYELADIQMPPNALYPAYVRGLANLQLGQGRQAAVEFQKLIDNPGIVALHVQGGMARLQLARAQAMMGDKAAARKSYQEFLTLWQNADPDVPIYQQAKAEYAKLQEGNAGRERASNGSRWLAKVTAGLHLILGKSAFAAIAAG